MIRPGKDDTFVLDFRNETDRHREGLRGLLRPYGGTTD